MMRKRRKYEFLSKVTPFAQSHANSIKEYSALNTSGLASESMSLTCSLIALLRHTKEIVTEENSRTGERHKTQTGQGWPEGDCEYRVHRKLTNAFKYLKSLYSDEELDVFPLTPRIGLKVDD